MAKNLQIVEVTIKVRDLDRPNYKKRSHSLPKGCKDVNDIVIPEKILLARFMVLVHRPPHVVMSDLMKLGMFAGPDHKIPFEMAAQLARKYGYKPIRRA